MDISVGIICENINGKLLTGKADLMVNSIDTDSRKITSGSLFFALEGENFDGHDYVLQALDNGASAVVVAKTIEITSANYSGKALIMVEDTLQALQDLAAYYRELFDMFVVAVTGSIGKTTIKELIYSCLQSKIRTLKTEGNYNNEIGLPLTIFNLNKEYQAAVVEMAMRGKGEILRLAEIARPTCAVISNIEEVHLETMGSLKNIAEAKCEVLSYLNEQQFALINGDNSLLLDESARYSCRKYTFGQKDICDFRVTDVDVNQNGMHISIDLMGQVEEFEIPLPARRLAANIAAAVGTAYLLGIDIDGIKTGLKAYKPSGNRLHLTRFKQGGTLINDTYNASPLSMTAALETGREIAGDGKLVAVLGDMFELGENEIEGHLAVGRAACKVNVDKLLTIGKLARYIAKGAVDAGMTSDRVYYFLTKEQSIEFLLENFDRRDTIIFKASRGMKFETLIDSLFK